MKHQNVNQNYIEYKQSIEGVSSPNDYDEEYAYEEYVQGDSNLEPSGYKREYHVIKEGPKIVQSRKYEQITQQQEYIYEDRIMPLNQKSNQNKKEYTVTRTQISQKSVINQKKPYSEKPTEYEVKQYKTTQLIPMTQGGKKIRKAYQCSPNTNYERNNNSYQQVKTQSRYKTTNYSLNKSPQQRTKHEVYISGANQGQPKQKYSFQINYSSVPKKDNLIQRKNNPIQSLDSSNRKVEIIQAEKRYKKTFNDATTSGINPSSNINTNNHNIYERKEVTKEKTTVAESPNNVNINFHRYSYEKFNPNITNTVSHVIDATSKLPKPQVVINQRKKEIIKADKHYRKTYNANENPSNEGNQYKYISQKGYIKNSQSNHKKNYSYGNKSNSRDDKPYAYHNTSGYIANNIGNREYNRLNNQNIRDNNTNSYSIVYSKKGDTGENRKIANTKSFTKTTTTTTTSIPDKKGKGYAIKTQTEKIIRTTGKDGQFKEVVKTKKIDKINDNPGIRANYYGQEEEEIYGEE